MSDIAKVCYCLDGNGEAHVHLAARPAPAEGRTVTHDDKGPHWCSVRGDGRWECEPRLSCMCRGDYICTECERLAEPPAPRCECAHCKRHDETAKALGPSAAAKRGGGA